MALMLLMDVLTAYILDLIFGDPYWFPHPVRFIGWLIKKTEKFLRSLLGKTKKNAEIFAGMWLMLLVVLVTFCIVFFILKLSALIHPYLFHILNIYFIYSSIASKCLADEAKKVYEVLLKKDIVAARERLAMLVGRQTEHLNEEEIIRGVVETTAENTVDGIISPLFYAILGSLFGIGAPLVYAFKAISTLDSMVGYMNDKYIYFGRVSAKTDDVLNYLPARISGLLIPAAAFLLGLNFKKSFQIMLRDRKNHKSPNCAYPEAAVAGALGIKIGGNNVYFGKVVEKPTIGDSDKILEAVDIKNTIRIMYVSSFVAIVVFGLVAGLFLL